MNTDLFQGKLARLSQENPQIMAEAFTRWNQDSEYYRLLDSETAWLWSANKIKEWFEKETDTGMPTKIFFSIRTVSASSVQGEDKLIGFIAFEDIAWSNRDAYVAIGIGERDFWGKGYGTDAMRLMLRYGFDELNLHRISLTVYEYNPRGIRCYEKCGFKHEGRIREFILRDGRRWDMLHMGILRDEWKVQKENND